MVADAHELSGCGGLPGLRELTVDAEFEAIGFAHGGRTGARDVPFSLAWLHLGANCNLWWEVWGTRDDLPGEGGVILRRVAGPYAVICLN